MTQLNIAGDLDAANLGMVQVYRQALASEALRAEVFAGNRSPLIFGDPEQWVALLFEEELGFAMLPVALLFEALRLFAAGEVARSEELRAKALDAAPASSGRMNGREFEWIADADTRIGPMLEAIINGRYFWVPFDRILEIRVEEPEDLRDLVWLPAEVKWVNGGDAVALIPVRYPGSESSPEPKIQLGRLTEWDQYGEDSYTGLGQRVLITDQDELSLLDLRNITLKTPVQAQEPQATPAASDESGSDG